MKSFNQYLKENINEILKEKEISFFFKYNNEIFGGDENSRLIFARIKHPDQDDPKSWAKEASFSAFNLKSLKKGEESERMFSSKDLNKLKIVEEDQALKELK